MKKLSKPIAIMAALVFIAATGMSAQVCRLVGNDCEGSCGPWFFASPTNNPVPINTPIQCVRTTKIVDGKTKVVCKCVLLHSAPDCKSENGARCDGDCPDVYPTLQDAIDKTNPIKGDCTTNWTGTSANCACRYVKGTKGN